MTPTVPSPWQILDLAATTDLAAIRKAYSRRLKGIDPAQDIEAFQRLRWAYEATLALARAAAAADGDAESDDSDDRPPAPTVAREIVSVPTTAETGSADVLNHAEPSIASVAVLLDRAVAELPGLPVTEQRHWLDQTLASSSLDQHGEFELLLLGRVLEDHRALRPCVATLISYFHWDEPVQIDNRRDHGVAMLHHHLRLDAAYTAAIDLLERIDAAAVLDFRRSMLRDHFADEANRLPLVDFAAVDLVVRGHPRFVRAAFPCIEYFRWRRLAEPTNNYERLQAHLLDPQQEIWPAVLAAATEDLLATLTRRKDFSGQQKLIFSDVRLNDKRWRESFELILRNRWESDRELPGREALAVHFGWKSDPAPALAAQASPTSEVWYRQPVPGTTPISGRDALLVLALVLLAIAIGVISITTHG